ncbi:MAG: hypothetical protein K0U45_03480 [Alphaproteobacteria bacterium]|nr:hypothetical protein [Alphaproteobacteria bacterium]
MTKNIKNGQEVLEEFITDIQNDENLDLNIVNIITNAHKNDKLTKTNLLNALEELRNNHENK